MHRINDQNGAAAMAQKVRTLFVDDLDGSEAEGTVRFGLDGTEYEIDLNAQHARQLRDALARYVAAGRRVGAGTRRSALQPDPGPRGGKDRATARKDPEEQSAQPGGARSHRARSVRP